MTRLVAFTRVRIAFACIAATAASLSAQAPDAATLASLKWRSIGPVNMAGRVTDVEVNPKNTKEFYITGAAGGVWKTVNAGTTFFSVWEKERIASIGDMAIAPSNPQILYIGTGEQNSRNSVAPGYGVYKSTNGGLSWESVGLEKTQHIGRILIHPTNPNIVYVAALGALWGSNPERGVYKTIDGGKTWTLIKFVSDKAGFVDLVMDPRNPEVLWAASYERVRKPAFLKSGGPGSALWRTSDGGRSWTEIKGGGFPETQKGRMNVVLAPSNPNIVYVMVEADSVRGKKPQQLLSGVYRSADGGRTWKWMNTINNRPFYFSQIRVDPKNPNRIYRMAVDFAFSDDGGYSWRTSMLGIHEDYHAMWINPADPDHFIIGGDAGIFQTWDRGGTYDTINNMPMGQFYGISYDFQVPYRVCGGLQDNGTSCGPSRRRNGLLQMTDWFQVASADGLMTAQDWADPNNVYYTTQGGNISRRNLATGEQQSARARTINTGQFVQQIAQLKGDGTTPPTADQQRQIDDLRAQMKRALADPTAAARWNWNSPFIVSRHNANVLYTGADKLFKSIEKGANPRAISGDLTRADAMWMRVSGGVDADGNQAADASGGITRDATGAEENSTIVTIGESPIRAGLIYTGSDDGKVFLTRNDGGTWEDLSNNMQGVPAMAHVAKVEPSHHDSATVYVVRDNHRENDFKPYLFVSTDWGKTFRSINGNLPDGSGVPASTYVLREDPVNPNVLYVGTETGVFASTNKGQSWFPLGANLPTVPVYDLQVHPRDRELIAGTHGRAIWIMDVSQLQQMTPAVLAKSAHLFEPPPAFQYVQPIQGSEPRGQRGWRGEGGPTGAEISYRLAAATPTAPRVLIVNAAGDTISRLTGTGNAGVNKVSWNFIASTDATAVNVEFAGGRGGRGGRGGFPDTAQVPGFPRGYNPRPGESFASPDSSGSPTAVARALAEAAGRGGAGRGGRGAGGGGGRGGRGAASTAETGDYRVVLDVGGQKQSAVLRVLRVQAGEPAVMAPRGGR